MENPAIANIRLLIVVPLMCVCVCVCHPPVWICFGSGNFRLVKVNAAISQFHHMLPSLVSLWEMAMDPCIVCGHIIHLLTPLQCEGCQQKRRRSHGHRDEDKRIIECEL